MLRVRIKLNLKIKLSLITIIYVIYILHSYLNFKKSLVVSYDGLGEIHSKQFE